jgi:hypothetical protein
MGDEDKGDQLSNAVKRVKKGTVRLQKEIGILAAKVKLAEAKMKAAKKAGKR